MVRKPRKIGTPDCPVRSFVLRRVKEIGSNLGEFSTALGRNASYAQQFIWRGSPRFLDRQAREAMAPLLGVAADNLIVPEDGVTWAHPVAEERIGAEVAHRLGAIVRELAREREAEQVEERRKAEAAAVPGIAIPALAAAGEGGGAGCDLPPSRPLPPELVPEPAGAVALLGELPQFTDADDIEAPPGGWQQRPAGLALGGASFALWITQPRGALRADVVLVRTGQPPRVGDLVVAVHGKRVAAVGELVALSSLEATVTQGDQPRGAAPAVFARGSVHLYKVAMAEFA